jgi:MerR family transcriptional regulator, heat shock protein HspR
MQTKLVFSIQEVSQITGVHAHTIRFWEKDFHEYLRPAKTPGGQRRYCMRDIDVIKRIKLLRYQDKYTIAGTINELEREDNMISPGVSGLRKKDEGQDVIRVKEVINNR